MRKKVAACVLVLLAVGAVLRLTRPTAVHAVGGGEVLGHLYAGTSDPAAVYRYVGGGDWEAISPTPGRAPAGPTPQQRQQADDGQPPLLGAAVLDLIHYEGHLYAGTVSQDGRGQVWRHDGGTAWSRVGDDLENGVSSLWTHLGKLYAATGRRGSRAYQYIPKDGGRTRAAWRPASEGAGQSTEPGEEPVGREAPGVWPRDRARHRGRTYVARDGAVMRRAPGEGTWETIATAPQGIRAMATDQHALYVGTGGTVYRLDEATGALEPLSEELGGSIEVLYSVAPSGLDLSQLERGDILLVRGPGLINGPVGFVATWLGGSYWIHGGMYAGGGAVVESSSAVAEDFGTVRTRSITETLFWKEENYWAAVRVRQEAARQAATNYAEGQEGDLYNIDYPFWGLPIKLFCQLLQPFSGIDPAVCCPHRTTDRETEDDCFYCTHLPWRAYHTQGVNLDSNAAWPANDFAPQAIPGDDLYYDDDVTLVEQRKGMRAVVVSLVGSPADMLVIDPQGRRTGFDPDAGEAINEIPDVTYGRFELPPAVDLLLPDTWEPNKRESDFISIPNLDGRWELQVHGSKEGEYTLGAELIDWQHHRTQTMTGTTEAGQVDVFTLVYPDRADGLILIGSEVYLPLVMRGKE